MPLTWDELHALSLARQFPSRPPADLAGLLEVTGPVQSQTARSAYLGLAARSGALTRSDLDEAYRAAAIVRGSNIRGTVHTSTPRQQVLLDVVARTGQRRLFERSLGVQGPDLDAVWAAVEQFAAPQWRTADELVAELRRVLIGVGGATVDPLDTQLGRYLAFGSGALVRRPGNGDWSGQAAAEYRQALAVHGVARPADVDAALDAAVLLHVRAHGPVSRSDIAWWSGLGLRVVDSVLDRLDLVRADGPLDRVYVDVRGAPAPGALDGVRLLPEFDAVFCGYDAKSRHRFVDPGHHEILWNSANGVLAPPLLVDGRVTGWWRLAGTGPNRSAQAHWFAGTRRPRKAELAEAFDAAAAMLGLSVTGLTISREQP